MRPIEQTREITDQGKSGSLNRVLNQNRMNQVRREIGIIADRSYRERLIDAEAYKSYKELAEGRENHQIGAAMLESARKFALEHENKAIRVHRKIMSAKMAKIASDVDEEFLMQKLVAENINFNKKAQEVETLIEQKLDRMRRDKDAFTKISQHHLVKNVGYLKVDASTKIKIPSEDDFLKLTVPERRELLEELQRNLPKAEAFAEEAEDTEDEALVAQYAKKLNEAVAEGIIGEKTAQKFRDGFRKVDEEEKEHWLAEFDNQMQRYETLWKEIRGSLRGQALLEIEKQIDQKGYSELLEEFGQKKAVESSRLGATYVASLEKYREEGIVGQYTVAQFVLRMNRLDLKGKYQAREKLPKEMLRYEQLWEQIHQLNEEQQEFMRSKIDLWDYAEFRSQLERFRAALPAEQEESSLSRIRSMEVREAIVDTEDLLSSQGTSKKKGFSTVLKKMFSHVSPEKFDATSFEAQIRERALVHHPHLSRDTKGRGSDDQVDLTQISKDVDLLEEVGKAKVIESEGFVQIESEGEHGEIYRDAQVLVNDDSSMKRFLSEEGHNSFRSVDAGGNDDLSLAIYTEDGRTVELSLDEVRVLEQYLEETDKDDEREAA